MAHKKIYSQEMQMMGKMATRGEAERKRGVSLIRREEF